MVKGEVDAIQSLTPRMSTAIADRDLNELGTVNDELAVHARRAVELTADPLWTTAELLPVAGPNLAAVRVAANAVDTVSADVVSPILDVAASLGDAQGPSNQALDAAVGADGPLDHAASALHRAATRLAGIPATGLITPVASGVAQLTDLVGNADAVLQPLTSSAGALPLLLGTDQPQTILLMVQNPAELRTGGGITGTFVQMRAADGRFTMQKMTDSSAFHYRTRQIAPIPDALTALYGNVIGRFVQDTTIPADFSLTARLASAWWTAHGGAVPDAVISIDPIVLQSLLAVTGPVTLGDGSTLSADNLVQRVLVDPYLTMTSEEQASFFAQSTASVFARVFTHGMSPVEWAEALAQPIQDDRISVWSADADAQKSIASGPLGGPLARQRLAGDSAYAVYFNDNTGGKMAPYMTTAISVAQGTCRADGKHTVAVSVSLTSTAPKDAGTMPISMTGGGLWGVGAGDIGMNVTVAAPAGAFFGGVTVDGKVNPSANEDAEGHPSSITHVNLQPGETNVLTFRFVVDDDAQAQIVHTPMLTAPEVTRTPLRCE